MAAIIDLDAREILDSRGNPTVEVRFCSRMVPWDALLFPPVPPPVSTRHTSCATVATATWARASTRQLARSGRDRRGYFGSEADDQRLIDKAMIELDGTDNKSRLGR